MLMEKAPAKINLVLDVINKREDNYHNLKMVMTTIDLYDTLAFEILHEDRIILKCDKPYVPTDERNFVYQTIKLMKDEFNIKKGVKVNIRKNIPVSAGLAGGSSNAAGAIRAMNRLFKLNLPLEDLIDIGSKVGSDVPFCVYNKTALVEGRGEKIIPLPKPPKCWVILAKPRFGVSTKEVFSKVKVNEIGHPDVDIVIKAIKENNYKLLYENLGNSLEDVTFKLHPEVRALKEQIIRLGADNALMSGSGPTVFGLTTKEGKAKRIINSLDHKLYSCFTVRMLG